jgi:glycosyltransferase involved in cell wall biosynthesis
MRRRARPAIGFRGFGAWTRVYKVMVAKVLFMSHDGSRTGAPMVLLHLLEWLRQNTPIQFEIVLREGGELQRDFAAVAPTSVLNPHNPASSGIVNRLLKKMAATLTSDNSVAQSLKVRLQAGEFGLIYSNTITNGTHVQMLAGHCPVITHVHELEHVIRHISTTPQALAMVKTQTTHYVAGSEMVRRNLAENHGIPREKIDLVYEAIPTSRVVPEEIERCRRALRQELGLTPTDLIIGAAGTTDWRKGTDLFVQLAGEVRRLSALPKIHFVWMGGDTEGQYFEGLRHDARLQGVGDRVHFLGTRKDNREVIAAYDIFALVSREDPFPLVNLEAASAGKPIVCFQGAGGAPEFVSDECGFVLPFLDIRGMAEKVLELVRSPELRERLGRRAAERVRESFDVAVAGPQIVSLISRVSPSIVPPSR